MGELTWSEIPRAIVVSIVSVLLGEFLVDGASNFAEIVGDAGSRTTPTSCISSRKLSGISESSTTGGAKGRISD